MTLPGPQQCVHCGSCISVCPVYRATGRESLTARGKLHLLATELAARPSALFQDLFARCLLCGACEKACPRGLPLREMIVRARSRFPPLYGQRGLRKAAARFALSRPALLDGLVRAGVALGDLVLLPADSGLRLRLGLLAQWQAEVPRTPPGGAAEAVPGRGDVLYFAGCLARYLQPAVAHATGRLTQHLLGKTLVQPELQVCCGLAAWSAGSLAEARRLAKGNIEAFAAGDGPILTSCASCCAHLAGYPELFADDPEWRGRAEAFSARVCEFASFIRAAMGTVRFRARGGRRVYYHEPCHLRFAREKAGVVAGLLRQVEGITVVEPQAGHLCCGQGGMFSLGYPELAERIFSAAHAAYAETAADLVVTGCSGCLLQWQAGLAMRGSAVVVAHPAVLLADCLAGEESGPT